MGTIDTTRVGNEKSVRFFRKVELLFKRHEVTESQVQALQRGYANLEERMQLLEKNGSGVTDSDLAEIQELRTRLRDQGIPFDARMKASGLQALLKKNEEGTDAK